MEGPEIGEANELKPEAFVDYNSQWSRFPAKEDPPEMTLGDALLQNVSFKGNFLGIVSAIDCSFFNVSFEDCTMVGDFTNCGFTNCYFGGAVLEGSMFKECQLTECDFTGANIEDVSLIDTQLSNCT